MRITKVYTRMGDNGQTSLADGTSIRKDDIRIEAYGTVDELNAVVGMCLNALSQEEATPAPSTPASGLRISVLEMLECIQHDLFNVGGDLATPVSNRFKGMVLVSEKEIERLEKLIDEMNEDLPPLKDFILPAGSASCSALHLARTVCRRAERRAVTLASQVEVNPCVVQFLNRLSDFFFVVSRYVLIRLDKKEVLWNKTGGLAREQLASQ